MKFANKLVSLGLIASMSLSIAACSKSTDTSDTTGDIDPAFQSAVSEAIDATPESSTEEEVAEETTGETLSTQITNEKGEYLIDGQTFEERYGSQLGVYLNHQYYFDGKPIPIYESNYYFIHEFAEFNNMALTNSVQIPITSEGFVDLSHELATGVSGDGYDFQCVGDMVQFYAEISLACSYICMDLGEERGVVLSETTKAEVQEQIDLVASMAEQSGLTLDQFLSVNYGKGFDEAAFREILYHYYYFDDFVREYDVPEEDLQTPQVCHALFMVNSDATAEEDAAQLQLAEEFLAQCESTDDLLAKGQMAASGGVVAECATYKIEKGRFVPEFESWAYDPSRKVGDMGIVKTTYGYHVMGFLGYADRDEIATELASQEIYSVYYTEAHEFKTNDTFEKPKPVDGPKTTDPSDSTEESAISSLPLDENGNLIVDTTDAGEPENSFGADKTNRGVMTVRIISASVAGVAIIAIIALIISTIVKGKNNKSNENEEDVEEVEEENTEDTED